MATLTTKEKAAASPSGLWHELFHVGIYKASQGRITRQATAATIIAIVAMMSYRLYLTMRAAQSIDFGPTLPYVVPALVLLAGVWLAFRLVNLPRFTDFLIAVEAEMNKVSWPGWPELRRASAVVIVVMLILGGSLFLFDLIWQMLFARLGVL